MKKNVCFIPRWWSYKTPQFSNCNYPSRTTQCIDNRNTHRWSYGTSLPEKGVPYHLGQAIVIPANT